MSRKRKNPPKKYKDAVIVPGRKQITFFDCIIYLFMSCLGGYIGYLIAGCIVNDTSKIVERIIFILQNPFSLSYWNGLISLFFIIGGFVIFGTFTLCISLDKKSYMHNKEHGSGMWASAKVINRTIDNRYNWEDKT